MEHDSIGKRLKLDQPSIARILDATLGGSAHFDVDRRALAQWLEVFPGQTDYAYINRAFLRRAVVELCERGIDQFLDLGSGIPTVGNVHEIAHRIDPNARIAYIDNDPVAVHHSIELLEMNGGAPTTVTVSDVDMRDPQAVLDTPGVAGLIDFSRPVAVLMLGILDIIDTSTTLAPSSIIAAYRDACPPGSALAVSNAAQQSITNEQVERILDLLAETPTPRGTYRSEQEVRDLFAGYQLLDPGVVPTAAWRPERPVSDHDAAKSNALAAVGLKRSR